MKTLLQPKSLTMLALCLFVIFFMPDGNEIKAQVTAKKIIEKAENAMRGETLYSEMSMKTVRPRFSREISMKIWSKGEKYSMVLIISPARDKGITYLKRGKEIWNFVPNIDRTIKMPPSMMSQSWMGSDFSNDDLVRESSSINDYTHKILDTVIFSGYKCWVLELEPKPESSIVYGKVKVWITQTHYLQLKTENYDEENKLVSTLLFKDLKVMGGRTVPSVMEMIPADKKGHKTIITYKEMKFNTKMEDSFFTVQNMKNIK